MDMLKTCFFTGHRRIASDKIELVKEKIAENIEELIIKYDVKCFITGGALGFDTLAAEQVIKMREKYPHIKLLLYLPCYGQSKRWHDKAKYRYRLVISNADDVLYVTEGEYTKECMHLRNKKMIKDSFFCIAFCIMDRSGTGLTLKNAKAADRKIINIADDIYK